MLSSLIPLAERLRPNTFENYVGQQHLIGEGSTLRSFIKKGIIPSMIFGDHQALEKLRWLILLLII